MLYFIRHGQSDFNQADTLLRQELGEKFSKQSAEYLALKFDEKFIDCGLTENGKNQCLKAQQKMKHIDVDLVIVSPMRRALQTCDIIFRQHKSNPKIIVDPDIREVFSSSCDIGGRIKQSMKQMPYFDYSKIKNPSYWYIDSIKNEKIRQQLLKQFQHIEDQQKNEQQAKKIKLKYLREQLPNITSKTFSNFQEQKVKYKQLNQKYKNIAIVSHYQNIYAVIGFASDNCEVVPFSSEKL